MTVENEKRVGVNSGGMDQSASILSLPSHALYISFFPILKPTQIPLPHTNPPTSLVIANSLKVSDKAVSAKWHYNLRVVETLVGARVLANGLKVEIGDTEKITLREVLAKWTNGHVDDVEHLEEALQKIDEEVERILGAGNGKTGLTFEEMVQASGMSTEAFNSVYLSWVEGMLSLSFRFGNTTTTDKASTVLARLQLKPRISISTGERSMSSTRLDEFCNSGESL